MKMRIDEGRTEVSLAVVRIIVVLGVFLSIVTACRPPEETPPPVNHCRDSALDCLWLIEVTPQIGAPLSRGKTYTMSLRGEHKLVSAQSGTIYLTVYDPQEWAYILIGSTVGETRVTQGMGQFQVSSTFAVSSPTVTAVRAWIPLYGEGITMPIQSWDIGPWPVQ